MGRRYYCDYCDKTFIDDLDARRKHLSGSLHIKLRKLHYEQHRDPKTILEEESQKTVCRRFVQHGECQFAGSCKYTHYTQEELWSLKQQIELEEYEKRCKTQETFEVPSIESWVDNYNLKTNKSEEINIDTYWGYPEYLECRSDLPPSMKKLKLEDFRDANFEEWGI